MGGAPRDRLGLWWKENQFKLMLYLKNGNEVEWEVGVRMSSLLFICSICQGKIDFLFLLS